MHKGYNARGAPRVRLEGTCYDLPEGRIRMTDTMKVESMRRKAPREKPTLNEPSGPEAARTSSVRSVQDGVDATCAPRVLALPAPGKAEK